MCGTQELSQRGALDNVSGSHSLAGDVRHVPMQAQPRMLSVTRQSRSRAAHTHRGEQITIAGGGRFLEEMDLWSQGSGQCFDDNHRESNRE